MRVALLFFVACSGRIENPEAFSACTMADPYAELVQPRCATSGCHGNGAIAAGLDLGAADAPQRLLQQHATGCANKVLVQETARGYLTEKLDERPACGRQMPLGGNPFTDEERACFVAWLLQVQP